MIPGAFFLYDFRMSYRWLYICLVLLFSAGRLIAETVACSVGSVTFTVDPVSGVMSWSTTLSSNATRYGNSYLQASANGGVSWSTAWERNVVLHGAGPHTGTTNLSVGILYRVTARALRHGDNVQVENENVLVSWDGPPTKKVRVELQNPSAVHEMKYKIFQDGVEIAEVTVPPATSMVDTIEVPGSSVVEVAAYVVGVERDGPSWVRDEEAVTELGPVETESGIPQEPSTEDPPPKEKYKSPLVMPPDDLPEAGSSTGIWDKGTDTKPDDLLTNATFKQGVDKLLKSQKSGNGLSNGLLEEIRNAVSEHRDIAKDRAKQEKDAIDANPSDSTMSSQGSSAETAIRALYGEAPSAVDYEGSGSAPSFTLSLPSMMGGGSIDWNPFRSDRWGPMASWCRQFMSWLCIVLLGGWIWQQIGEWTRGLAGLRQARGNPVVGGTGAQATALVAAGLMTTAIVVCTTAILAWAFGSISLSTILSTVGLNPLGSMPSAILWCLDQIFPLATMLTCLAARLSFNLYASALYAGCAAVVRFVVP